MAWARAPAGGWSISGELVRAGAPHTASSRANPARSATSISGTGNRGRRPASDGIPRPVGDAGPEPPGPPGALLGRRQRGRLGLEPGHARGRDRTAGTRTRPASTTIRTPATVRLDSAMSVASTTRRRPGGDGASACVLLAQVERAEQRPDVDVGGQRARAR